MSSDELIPTALTPCRDGRRLAGLHGGDRSGEPPPVVMPPCPSGQSLLRPSRRRNLADPRGGRGLPWPSCYRPPMLTSRPARLALPALVLALLVAPADVSAQYRYLCTSIPAACMYTGPNAPVLKADVCYGSAIGIRLKGSAPCPSGSWPYFVDAGEVIDPVTNAVAAYIPLDDACGQPGLCVDGPPPGGTQEYPMCCNSNNVCTHNTVDCQGTKLFCHDGVCEPDGTITCFHADPI